MFTIRNLLPCFIIIASLISFGCQPRAVSPVTADQGLTNAQIQARAQLKTKGLEFTEQDFIESARNGDTASVDLFLRAGFDVNYQHPTLGYTVLMWASENGHSETVEALIGRGADFSISTMRGWNAMMGPSMNCYPRTVGILVNAGMDLNAKDDGGWTALMWAAKNRCTDVVQILIDAGADVNVRDARGKTALTITRDEDIKTMLRAAGARQ